MNRGNLTISVVSLLAGLLGGLLLVIDLWVKNAPVSALSPLILPTINGIVEEGEYVGFTHDEVTGMTLYWTISGNQAFFALTSPGQGWLALGLAPEGPMMQGADIVMGYVQDGQVFIQDHFGDTPVSHQHDTDAGGSENLLVTAGSENENGTVLEWSRLLSTGDERDKSVTETGVFVQLAYAQSDDWTTYHTKRNTIQVNFETLEEGRR